MKSCFSLPSSWWFVESTDLVLVLRPESSRPARDFCTTRRILFNTLPAGAIFYRSPSLSFGDEVLSLWLRCFASFFAFLFLCLRAALCCSAEQRSRAVFTCLAFRRRGSTGTGQSRISTGTHASSKEPVVHCPSPSTLSQFPTCPALFAYPVLLRQEELCSLSHKCLSPRVITSYEATRDDILFLPRKA